MTIVSKRQAYVEAFNRQDVTALTAFYAVGALRKRPGADDALGAEEIAAVLEDHFATFGEQVVADHRVFLNGNVATAIWAWRARHTGPFHGVAATGNTVGLLGASVFWFDADGLIAKEHTFWDPYGILKQLGIGHEAGRPLPEMPAAPRIYAARNDAAEASNIRHLRTYHDHLLSGRKSPWLDYMTDDIAWDDQMAPGLAVGKEHSASDFDMLRGAFENPKIATTDVWGNQEFVIHQGTFIAKHVGELKGIPASNRVVHVDNIDIIHFSDQKIDQGWSFGNSMDMGYQLGVGTP